MVLFASESEDIMENLREQIAPLPAQSPLRLLMLRVLDSLERAEAGPLILTDDKAPVELLGMQVIDELIARNLIYYQELLEEGGINDLLRGMGLM
jgi:hypothetical protein